MTDSRRHFAPDGWPAVVPRLFARDAGRLVEFIKKVFAATGEYRDAAPAVISIGDSMIMVAEAEARGPQNACLYVYVGDADAAYQRALSAGACSLEAPFDTPYGDRRGMVRDEWGNVWQIATYRK